MKRNILVIWILTMVSGIPAVHGEHNHTFLTPEISTFLEQIQHGAFDYFWNECGTNGLVQDRMSDKVLSSTMAAGFQLTVYSIGAERGWISRETAAERVLLVLKTYAKLPRFHGMYAHYYDISTGQVIPLMHEVDDGADVSETGFFMAGVLFCRQYFSRDTPTEQSIRALATRLFEEVEWDWMLQDAAGNQHKTLAWHWSPNHGFAIGQRVKSNMELSSMITYLLAMGSPTHPIPADCWNEGWTRNYVWWHQNGPRFIACPPLFSHQYAHAWIDFRNRRDRFADYFRNATWATRANRDYCRKHLYPERNVWGLTYCDGPEGYGIYGYPPRRGEIDQDAVTPPTAPAGSIVYTPRDSISTLAYIYNNLYTEMWGPYGLYDAFSLKHDWFFHDYVAIDEGPIVMQIENLRSGFVWNYFMRDPVIQRGLAKAGFRGVIDNFEPRPSVKPYNLWESSPWYAQQLTHENAREGDYALQVTYNKGGQAGAALKAHPSRRNFSEYKYLSLWLRNLDYLTVELEDSAGQTVTLPIADQIKQPDAWRHLYYRLPKNESFLLGDVSTVSFIAAPQSTEAKGTFELDAVYLSPDMYSESPAPVQGLQVRNTRMPGEVKLSWKAPEEAVKQRHPFQYHVRYSRRAIRNYENFKHALPVPAAAADRIAGTDTEIYMNGLAPGETFYFAAQAEDIDRHLSEVSNTVSVELPRERKPMEFIIDDFDGTEGVNAHVEWESTCDTLQAVVTDETALEGPRCMRISYNKQGPDDAWCYVEAQLDFRDFSDYRYLMMWVAGQADILVKAWNSEDLQEDIDTQTSALPDGWSPLYFDLSKLQKINGKAVARLLIFPQPGKTDCRGDIWIDSIQLTRSRN